MRYDRTLRFHDVTFFESTGGLRGFKRSLYEGGVRSPSIASWPGTIRPGTVSDRFEESRIGRPVLALAR